MLENYGKPARALTRVKKHGREPRPVLQALASRSDLVDRRKPSRSCRSPTDRRPICWQNNDHSSLGRASSEALGKASLKQHLLRLLADHSSGWAGPRAGGQMPCRRSGHPNFYFSKNSYLSIPETVQTLSHSVKCGGARSALCRTIAERLLFQAHLQPALVK